MVIKRDRVRSEKESPIRSNLDIARKTARVKNLVRLSLWTFSFFFFLSISFQYSIRIMFVERISSEQKKKKENTLKQNNNVHIGFIYSTKLCSRIDEMNPKRILSISYDLLSFVTNMKIKYCFLMLCGDGI